MPSCAPAAATSFAQSADFVTSACTKLPPTSLATRLPASALMSFTMTRAPSSAKRRAMPAPKPEPAPVTIATLSFSLISASFLFLRFFERAMFAQLVDVARDAGAFALQELFHRAREPRMRQPVRRRALDRQQAAEDLVLALRAAFEHLQAVRDRVFDRLVVAAFEMQQRHVLERAPVTSVEPVFVLDEERACDRPARALGDHQREVLRQRGADAQEEIQAEIGARAVLGVGAAVAAVEELPVPALDRLPLEPRKRNPRLAHPPALLADVLAPLVRHAQQEVVEVGVPGVAPVELYRAPQHHALAEQHGKLVFRGKQDMQRGRVARELQRGLDQNRLVLAEQPVPAHRSEGDCAQQLGVVLDAVALVRVGPRPVEHGLTVGMRLGEEWP